MAYSAPMRHNRLEVGILHNLSILKCCHSLSSRYPGNFKFEFEIETERWSHSWGCCWWNCRTCSYRRLCGMVHCQAPSLPHKEIGRFQRHRWRKQYSKCLPHYYATPNGSANPNCAPTPSLRTMFFMVMRYHAQLLAQDPYDPSSFPAAVAT